VRSYFVAQSFMMSNRDILYVSNAPIDKVQKFLLLVQSVVSPVVSWMTVENYINNN
jgi:polysaccharide export outer membrane protein